VDARLGGGSQPTSKPVPSKELPSSPPPQPPIAYGKKGSFSVPNPLDSNAPSSEISRLIDYYRNPPDLTSTAKEGSQISAEIIMKDFVKLLLRGMKEYSNETIVCGFNGTTIEWSVFPEPVSKMLENINNENPELFPEKITNASCDLNNPHNILQILKDAIDLAEKNQKYWDNLTNIEVVAVVLGLFALFFSWGYCCNVSCRESVDSCIGNTFVFPIHNAGIYLVKLGSDLIIRLHRRGSYIYIKFKNMFNNIKNFSFKNNMIYPSIPEERSLTPEEITKVEIAIYQNDPTIQGGAKKQSKDYTKTKEKYGTRCVYLSKRNAKFLKVNGEFISYKKAIEKLNKKNKKS